MRFESDDGMLRQAEINGELIEYDSLNCFHTIEIIKEFYPNTYPVYVGSSKVYYINGVRNQTQHINHYYKKC